MRRMGGRDEHCASSRRARARSARLGASRSIGWCDRPEGRANALTLRGPYVMIAPRELPFSGLATAPTESPMILDPLRLLPLGAALLTSALIPGAVRALTFSAASASIGGDGGTDHLTTEPATRADY